MKRGTRIALRLILGFVGLLLILLLVTPFGPWVLTRALDSVAGGLGWQVTVADHDGSLLTGFRLEEVTASSPETGVEARLEALEFAPWSYAVALEHLDIRLQIPEEETATEEEVEEVEPLRLPVEHLPDLDLTEGRLSVTWTGREQALQVDGLAATYRATGDTTGRLDFTLDELALSDSGAAQIRARLSASLSLGPSSLALDSLGVAGQLDTLSFAGLLQGRLALLAGMPAALRLDSRLQSASGALDLDGRIDLEGNLQPLDFRLDLQARARIPALQQVDARGTARVDTARVAIDSLDLKLLGGTLAAQALYFVPEDSLEGRLQLRAIDWAPLAGEVRSGPIDGDLSFALNLTKRRYDVDLEAIVHALELVPDEPLDFRLQGSQRPDGRTHLSLHSSVLELVASGRSDPSSLPAAGSYDLDISGRFRAGSFIGMSAPPVAISGNARPDSLHLQLATPHLPGPLGQKFGRLAIDLDLTQNRFLDARLALEEHLLQLWMRMDVEKGELDSLVSFLSPLALQRFEPGLEGRVNGQLRASGPLDIGDLRLASRFEMPGVAYGDWNTGPISLSFDYRDQLATCILEGSGLHLEARADTALQTTVDARFDGAVLHHRSASTPSTEAAGLTGRLTWRGNLHTPGKGLGELELEEFLLRQADWQVSALDTLRLRQQDESLYFDRVALQTPIGLVRLRGSASPDSLAARLEIPAIDLSQVAADVDLEGDGEFLLNGTLQRPLVDGRIELRRIRLDTLLLGDARIDLALRDSLRMRAELLQGAALQPTAKLALDLPVAALLQGTDATGDTLDLDLAFDQVELNAPLSFLAAQSVRGRLALAGSISLPLARLDTAFAWRDLSGELRFDRLSVATEMQGDSLRLEMVPGGRITLVEDRLMLRDLQVWLERYEREANDFLPAGRLQLGGQLLEGTGSRIELDLKEIDLPTFDGPDGTLDLHALIGGTLTEPELGVDLGIDTEDLGTIRGRLGGQAEGGQFRATWTTSMEDSLTVEGILPWSWEQGQLDEANACVHIHSSGILLLPFVDQMPELDHLDGIVRTDLQVEGLGEDLRLDGYIEVEDLEFAPLDIRPTYLFPHGRLVFSGRRGEFVDFVSPATKKNGRMALTGYVDLTTFDDPRFAVGLETDDLVCRYEDIFNAPRIDMSLTLEGSTTGARLAGSIRLDDALAEPVLVTLNAPPVPPPPPTLRDEFLENMALDVLVDIRNMKVDSELAKVTMAGALDVGGTFYKPIFQGEIGIDEGQVFILNRQFDFEQGRIVLSSLVPTRSLLAVAYDPLILDPELDLTASCNLVDRDDDIEYKVTLSVQGTALNPAPEFSSTPAKEFSDIFNLLAFGTTNTDQQAYGGVLGVAAGQLLSKQVEKVGLDEFTVLPSGTVLGTVGEPSLRLGRYFDELPLPLWIRYEAAVREISLGEVRLEHRLNSYLTISGRAQSSEERYGLGIGLKKDF